MALTTEARRSYIQKEKELDDIFDSVTSFESRTLEEGYLTGLEEGREESAVRGFTVGFNTGSSISLDLGQALAFCTTIRNSPPASRPHSLIKLCDEVIGKVKGFPKTNVDTEDVLAKSAEIKALLDRVKLMVTKKPVLDEVRGQKYSI